MNPYIGHESQLSGIEEYCIQGGKGHGMHLLEVVNGKGLRMTISSDRCADISRLSFLGKNFSYFSPVGYVAPAYYDRTDDEFLRSFTAGFLTTCGLTNAGVACIDDGEKFPLHGQIGNIPAEHIYYQNKETQMVIYATIKDHRIFARKLTLERNITISKVSNKFSVHDTIVNEGDEAEPICILYHYNLGYPLLSEELMVFMNSVNVTPRDERAKEGIEQYNVMEKPQDGFKEQCYSHVFHNKAKVAVFNPTIGCGLSMEFESEQLRYFTEWKMMGNRDYVLGLEPGNTHVLGRDIMRKDNALTMLEPGESFTYTVNFEIVESLEDYKKECNDRKKGETQ